MLMRWKAAGAGEGLGRLLTMKTQGWLERKNSNWPGMMGGHGREAINNSLVYTGRAATLRNAGHPGGDGKEKRKVRLPDFYVLFHGCSHFRRGKTHKQCPDKLSLLQNPQIFHTGDIQVEVCRRFLTENQLKTHTVPPPKTTRPLSPSTLVPPPTFKSSAF